MDKKYTYTIIGVVAIALIIWAIYAYNHKDSDNYSQNSQGQTNGEYGNAGTPTSTTPTESTGKLSYTNAVKAYPNRFQFSGCKGTPNSLAVRSGTVVMLDNRTPATITVKADAQTYNIAGLDYALEHTSTIGNLVVTCNGKDSVTLNVEK